METENKLPKEFKEKWIAALRSGEYEQQREGVLVSDGKYCCLAVGAIANGIQISPSGLRMMVENIECSYMPIQKLIGFSNVDYLYSMNDRGNKTFHEIADWIEENL